MPTELVDLVEIRNGPIVSYTEFLAALTLVPRRSHANVHSLGRLGAGRTKAAAPFASVGDVPFDETVGSLTRCWSEGDWNRRSSLAFSPLGKEAEA